MYRAKELAARYGFDLESPAFWRRGFAVLAEKVEELERRLA